MAAAFRWRPGRPVTEELRRIARAEVERALADSELEDRDGAVHEVRKRGKELRALVRLVRPAAPELYARENTAFRDATKPLSGVRDAAVAVAAFDDLVAHFGDDLDPAPLRPLRDDLTARRDAATRVVQERALTTVQHDLRAARDRIDTWELDGEGFEVLAGGLERTYRRARDRMVDAFDDPSSAAFHEWRKRAKYHRHHLELLQPTWKRVIAAQRRELHRLTEILGDDHDLAVLRDLLVDDPDGRGNDGAVEVTVGLLDRRRAGLQTDARTLGRRCFAEHPGALVDRIAVYWEAAAAAAQDAGSSAVAVVPPGR